MSDISHGAEKFLDDMVSDMDNSGVDTHYVPQLKNIPGEVVPFSLWESIAYDLALGMYEPEQVAIAYSVELDSLQDLMGNDKFRKMLDVKKSEVDGLGDGADFTVKLRMIVNQATPKLLKRLLSNGTEDKDFIRLFGMAVKLAQLEPAESKDDEHAPVVPGAGININLYGMPGLDHLDNNYDGNKNKVIDVGNSETPDALNIGLDTGGILPCL